MIVKNLKDSLSLDHCHVVENRVYLKSEILEKELSRIFDNCILLVGEKLTIDDDGREYSAIFDYASTLMSGNIWIGSDNSSKQVDLSEKSYLKLYGHYCLKLNTHEDAIDLAKLIERKIQDERRKKFGQINNFEFVLTEKYEDILNRINLFFTPETKGFYDDLGINYRRGVLLYGKPGTGKSSFAKEIIKIHNDAKVYRGFSRIPKDNGKKIIFIDEIEGLIENGEETRSSLLITIEELPPNSLLLATTNRPEMFDVAFFNRPGRFDDVLLCDYPSEKDRESFLKSKKIDCADLLDFTEGLTFAHINELIYRVKMNKEDPEVAYKVMKELNKKEEILNTEKDKKRVGFGRQWSSDED